jgi:hypothetical protein
MEKIPTNIRPIKIISEINMDRNEILKWKEPFSE